MKKSPENLSFSGLYFLLIQINQVDYMYMALGYLVEYLEPNKQVGILSNQLALR